MILGVGIWSLVDDNALKLMHVASVDSDDDLIRGAAITFCVIGAIVFVTGFLGCCGAMRESSCMLMMVSIYCQRKKFLFYQKIINTVVLW